MIVFSSYVANLRAQFLHTNRLHWFKWCERVCTRANASVRVRVFIFSFHISMWMSIWISHSDLNLLHFRDILTLEFSYFNYASHQLGVCVFFCSDRCRCRWNSRFARNENVFNQILWNIQQKWVILIYNITQETLHCASTIDNESETCSIIEEQ